MTRACRRCEAVLPIDTTTGEGVPLGRMDVPAHRWTINVCGNCGPVESDGDGVMARCPHCRRGVSRVEVVPASLRTTAKAALDA